ncbi:unnamed protein product [Phytophthora fragariaefolia]|uniref:Unnamed protein product n=1 Tax=Phytophthora fragariaefolia TaxID=1490495 RepID=A0A9W6YC42_9STRA|nr:unnamed protein product [Phytophthora fragariaefolia]
MTCLFCADSTELRRLLAQYTQAAADYEKRKAEAKENPQFCQRTISLPTRHSPDSEPDDGLTENYPESTSTPTRPASVRSTPEPGKTPPKIRFSFHDWHDILLLNAVLADEGVITATGERLPCWKDITVSLKCHGLDVKTHELCARLQQMVDMYQKESGSWDLESLADKQKLLREYCTQLNGGKGQGSRTRNDDYSSRPEPEVHDNDSFSDPETTAVVPERAGPTQTDAFIETSQRNRSAILGANPSQTHNSVAISAQTSTAASAPANQFLSIARLSPYLDSPVISIQTTESFSVPSATRGLATTLSEADSEKADFAEPSWKRQKLEIETILERFVSEQSEYQKEKRDQEHIRLSGQQDLQRQTIELQKRALDMQEKSISMQDRLVSLMEKIMDKIT